MRKTPTRVLVAATSLLAVAASVLAVTASAQSGAGANDRTRPFHLTKECGPDYHGGIGAYCTVTSSNVPAIRVGTKIFYAQAGAPDGSLDSDVILYAGPRNTATGHCAVDPAGLWKVHALRRNRDARRHSCSCRRLAPGRARLRLGRDVPVPLGRRRVTVSQEAQGRAPKPPAPKRFLSERMPLLRVVLTGSARTRGQRGRRRAGGRIAPAPAKAAVNSRFSSS